MGVILMKKIILTILVIIIMSSSAFGSEDTNKAQATIQHIFPIWSNSDIVLDEPTQSAEQWSWFVKNEVDNTGEPVYDVKFTVETDIPMTWYESPTSENPPIYVWDHGIDVLEQYHYNVIGGVQGIERNPGFTVKRTVTPTLLSELETLQTIEIEVVFNSFPSEGDMGLLVSIGSGKHISLIGIHEQLMTVELISQNDVVGWWKRPLDGMYEWQSSNDEITLGVVYKFIAEIKTIKSPKMIGDFEYKPGVQVDMMEQYNPEQSVIGNSVSLSHPDGVAVIFEAANVIEWQPDTRISWPVFLNDMVPNFYPCGDDQYCIFEDRDNDGIPDEEDNCPDNYNRGQWDWDDDGLGNACDPDDDNDGVVDWEDNCKWSPNPDQLNTDGDNRGDVCDNDDDNDNVLDTEDNCPLVYNPGQEDTDEDGIADACDNCPNVYNPPEPARYEFVEQANINLAVDLLGGTDFEFNLNEGFNIDNAYLWYLQFPEEGEIILNLLTAKNGIDWLVEEEVPFTGDYTSAEGLKFALTSEDDDIVRGISCENAKDSDFYIEDEDEFPPGILVDFSPFEIPFTSTCARLESDPSKIWEIRNFIADGSASFDVYRYYPAEQLDTDYDGIGDACEFLCDPNADWKNHGAYVSCVTKEAQELVKQGIITGKEKGEIVSNAAQSDVGKK